MEQLPQWDFDAVVDRRGGDSIKWNAAGDTVAMWYADADFLSPPAVRAALERRAAHGVYGYVSEPAGLRARIVKRMATRYGWRITRDDIVWVPGIIPGFNLAYQMIAEPGAGVVVQAPTFYPISRDLTLHDLVAQPAQLRRWEAGHTVHFAYDPDAFAAAFTPATRMVSLCHPHNPTGLVVDRAALEHMASVSLAHGAVIVSDEIHCDIALDGTPHIPLAALSPEVAQQTITLMSPSKAYNIPGLGLGYAIIPNPTLRARYVAASAGMLAHPTAFGYAGVAAAIIDGDPWLTAANAYCAANLAYAQAYLARHLPRLRATQPRSTYLWWIDCRDAGIVGNPSRFFAQHGVLLGDGAPFGGDSAGFVRMTLACPRATLLAGLEAMRRALDSI